MTDEKRSPGGLPEVPDLDMPVKRPSLAPPAPRGSTHGVRERGRTRHEALNHQAIIDSRRAVEVMGKLMEALKKTPGQSAVDKVVASPDFVKKVADLQIVTGRVFQELQFILSTLNTPSAIDPQTGDPVLNGDSLARMQVNLDSADRHLGSSVPQLRHPPEDLQLTPPDHDLVKLLHVVNNSPHFFNSPVAVERVFMILDDYLRSFIQATHLGLVNEVGLTRMEVRKIKDAAVAVEAEHQDDVLYGNPTNPETLRAWQNLLIEVEYTFAGLYTNLHMILGPQADALLRHIPERAIRKMLADVNDQAAGRPVRLPPGSPAVAVTEGQSALSRFFEGIKSMVSAKESPGRPVTVPPPPPVRRELEQTRSELMAVLRRKTMLNNTEK